MSHHLLNHPNLGKVQGVERSNGLVQYLGIQYATLTDRFARAELIKPVSADVDRILDATKYGNTVLLPPNAWESEHRLIGQSLPSTHVEQSDLEGLRINITVPSGSYNGGLPVLFFVHGGGFSTGSSVYPQYDLAAITKLSVDLGSPIVSVSINYRVGPAGFLTSAYMKEAGYKPNNGLDDQRLALRWVQDNIAGFGGDPKQVTFIGESAGGNSGCLHLHAADPLFQQFISMSGTSLLRPRPIPVLERSFGQIAAVLGAKDQPAEKQLETLLQTPSETFSEQVGRKFVVGPVIDGDVIPEMTTFKALADKEEFMRLFPGVRRCTRLLIGDCEMDGMIWGGALATRMDIFPVTLRNSLSAVFDPVDRSITPAIMAAYNFDASITANSKEATRSSLRRSMVEVRGFEQHPFLYHFNAPNPWDGPWKGVATHMQDLVFVLQNYRDQIAPGQRQTAERFATDLIAFVHGSNPWPAFRVDEAPGAMVYDAPAEGDRDASSFIVDGAKDQTHRRDILQRLLNETLYDKAVDAWLLFMRGPQ